ncbi:hypothetical protein G7K_3457-t1 [Saitoella complicata NRRL Y-17804]|uniref:Bifunctional lycopene cyclase/phytoene synthase n=2 Tax=Saitoella complicata (strain BCRC 22490 / CBS 7301 / JCM 7358 / NBRC 10748 / NRRL Y-17804) TaxID=698492 RepID=A0A0E9NHX8_SAICN|nr:hypothetical protein G7K_3457-t1 [Saitoella complicata NRRL Y-17804]
MGQLTYFQVHLLFTLPPLLLLQLLYQPLRTPQDTIKWSFLILIAVIYTTPWDNYIIYHDAWWYCPTCVVGTIGWVPIEEYLFFVVQTWGVGTLFSLLTRVERLPILDVRPMGNSVRVVPCAVLLAFGAWAYSLAIPGEKTFYMACIVAWISPVLAFLWYLSASYTLRRPLSFILSLTLPTVYLWVVDTVAMRAGVWHISERTSLEWEVWRGMPVEEAVFFAVTTGVVVLGCSAFDLAAALLHTYADVAPALKGVDTTPSFSLSYFGALVRALLTHEFGQLDELLVDDIASSIDILREASSSFYTSSFVFGPEMRQNLCVVYAFCRVTDDVADEASHGTVEERKKKLGEMKRWVADTFPSREELEVGEVKKIEGEVKHENPAFRTLGRLLRTKIPKEPLLELFQGYEWDLEGKRKVHTESDLLKYSSYVASTVAEICVWLMLPNTNESCGPMPRAEVMQKAREMGLVLQLVNISRDILTDAAMGRCYVPFTYTSPGELPELLALASHNPPGPALERVVRQNGLAGRCKSWARRMLGVAGGMYEGSWTAIGSLPRGCRPGVRSACEAYWAIGGEVGRVCKEGGDGVYPMRARIGRWKRLWIVVKAIYRPEISVAEWGMGWKGVGSVGGMMWAAGVMRAVLLCYGMWQDAHSPLKYTDIDYQVFTDAAKYVWRGGSPYERDTYRYTPLLAWMVVPTAWGGAWTAWGKVLFAVGDLVAGYCTIRILQLRGMRTARALNFSALWLLNPLVAVISTRGNAEGLLGAMVVGSLLAVVKKRTHTAGVLMGLAVHFKIYPIVYVPAVLVAMDESYEGSVEAPAGEGVKTEVDGEEEVSKEEKAWVEKGLAWVNPSRFNFAFASAVTFVGLTCGMYYLYDAEFLEHTYFHHLKRSDHRHNFSPYQLLLYLSASPAIKASQWIPFHSFAFVPQLLLSCVVLPFAFAGRDLPGTMFAQTFAFVAFNKVCTSQYFMWYLVLLPLYLPNSPLLTKPYKGLAALALWVGAQAVWLHRAYALEFLGENTFFPGLWVAGMLFFGVNVWILGVVVGKLGGPGMWDKRGVVRKIYWG